MGTKFALRALAAAVGAVTLAACSGETATSGVPAPPDYPAFAPGVPQLQQGALAPIATPVIVPVYFGDDPLRADIQQALLSWKSSASVATLGEYGIRSVAIGNPIHVTAGIPPRASTSKELQTWVALQLDGMNPIWGPVDAKTLASEIFVGFAGDGSTIMRDDARSCADFTSYSAGVTLATGAVAHYVVVARCPSPIRGVSQSEWTAHAAVNGIMDAIGNPIPSMAPAVTSGWGGAFDVAHGGFALAGAGLGSVCEQAAFGIDGSYGWAPNGLPLVSRVWSNTAAASYRDPCVPAPSGEYFASVPLATDMVTLPTGDLAAGVLVPAGGSRTIDVQLLSSGPTGPWWVSTQLLNYGLPHGGTSDFGFTWDKPVGNNGDTLHLTVYAPNPPRQDVVAIYSTRDDRRTFWLLPLQSQ